MIVGPALGSRLPGLEKWRRERDSNPRYTFWAYTRFPVVLLQPLGHLSANSIKLLVHLTRDSFLAENTGNLQSVFIHERSLAKVAERVGFEPTCPALHRTTRFRVEPGTATSVPLRFQAFCRNPIKNKNFRIPLLRFRKLNNNHSGFATENDPGKRQRRFNPGAAQKRRAKFRRSARPAPLRLHLSDG